MDHELMYRAPAGAEAIAASYERRLKHWPQSFQPIRFATNLGEAFAMRGGVEDGPAGKQRRRPLNEVTVMVSKW